MALRVVVFSSPEPKAQVSFSDQTLSVARRRCGRRCRNFFTFSSSPEPLSQFQPNLAQSILVKGIKFCSNEGPRPFRRGDNYKIVKIHRRN